MKQNILTPVTLLIALLVILASCKKDPVPAPIPTPGKDPVPGGQKAIVRFTTNLDLTGQPYHSSNLQAIVSIKNHRNEEVIKDSTLLLNLNEPVTTTTIELPVGTYHLTSFRIEYGGVHTHFVAPIAGSSKALLVQKPLAFAFKVEKDILNAVPVEALKVQNGEKPAAYGYAAGAFDRGQSDADPFLKVKLRAIMQIGNVLYDSVPASLVITTWNADGQMNTTYSALKAGVNEVSVHKAAVKYEFRVTKWGTSDAITLNRQDIDAATVYTLGGIKAAKKLKSERTYKEVNGTYVPDSKADYIYNAAGNLYLIEHWLRKADNTNYLSMTDRFEYTGTRVQKISRVDAQTRRVIQETSFTYDNQGKVTSITQLENGAQTSARVEYYHYARPEINIHYDFPGANDLDYYTDFSGGNTVSSTARRTNGDTEQGSFEYDLNINPYRHMNWPDLFLSHNSKNNLVVQRKQYFGSYPVNEPYSFNYTYDADGYPSSLIKNFKSYTSGTHIFSTKTIFVY